MPKAKGPIDTDNGNDAGPPPYQKTAIFWRTLALVQIPITLFCLVFALLMWISRGTYFKVEDPLLPGHYATSEIPDKEFISVATEWINLVATYQPKVARKQFNKAEEYLIEPMLSVFASKFLGQELTAIEQTMRSQMYFVDPFSTSVTRDESGDFAIVTLMGEREKIADGDELPIESSYFQITMTTTVPEDTVNQYGIVITDVQSDLPPFDRLAPQAEEDAE